MELEKPLPSDCCESGCSPCVFDIYEQRLHLWRENQTDENLASESLSRTDLLSQTRFKPFRLIEKFQLSEDVFKFRFQAVEKILTEYNMIEEIRGSLPYTIGQHFMLRCYLNNSGNRVEDGAGSIGAEYLGFPGKTELVNSDSAQPTKDQMVTRAYTPVTIAAQEKNCCFDIFAKLYKNGIASDYLKQSLVGDILYWRGPYGEFQCKSNSFSYILMLCVGTGLAPMIPIVKSILNNESDETRIHLMFGVKNVNHIILRDDLRKMTRYWNFTLEYFVSEHIGYNNNVKFGENINYRRIDNISVTEKIKEKSLEKLLILVCGTESFIRDVKSVIADLGNTVNVHIF